MAVTKILAEENFISFLRKKDVTFFSTNFVVLEFTSEDNLTNLLSYPNFFAAKFKYKGSIGMQCPP